jgi:hypothetical protein
MFDTYQSPAAPVGRAWTDKAPTRHGADDNATAVFPGRRVLSGHWTHTPETCPDNLPGEWLPTEGDDAVLICPSCGLDCT